MARFAMITEADARMLPEGSTVELLPKGHITPLAADTLRDRRITVIRADQVVDGDGADLVPVADVRRVVIGSDHTGVALRMHLLASLRARGLAVTSVGPEGAAPPPADYPDIAEQVGARRRAARSRRGHRHRWRRPRLDDGRQQGGRCACGAVPERDAGALRAPAQWRERARARRHAGVAGRRAGDRRDVPEDADDRAALHPSACQAAAAGHDPRS